MVFREIYGSSDECFGSPNKNLTPEEKCLESIKLSASGIIPVNKNEDPYKKINVLKGVLGEKYRIVYDSEKKSIIYDTHNKIGLSKKVRTSFGN